MTTKSTKTDNTTDRDQTEQNRQTETKTDQLDTGNKKDDVLSPVFILRDRFHLPSQSFHHGALGVNVLSLVGAV